MNIIIKIIRKILKKIGYKQISYFFQNIFRSRFQIDMYIAQVNVVANVHKKTFEEYRNKYQGKDIVVIATGPSLNKYKPIQNAINVVVNKAIYYDKIKPDYFFAIDYTAVGSYLRDLKNYPDVKKFYGILPKHPFGYREESTFKTKAIIPESIILEHGANKFFVYEKRPKHDQPFNVDIDSTWLVGDSCIFSAIQFALFTNPKRIYIVGCDCSSGYFDGKKGIDCSFLIKTWKNLKDFKDIYYPDTEIISVNPVGLKGLFTDLYQE